MADSDPAALVAVADPPAVLDYVSPGAAGAAGRRWPPPGPVAVTLTVVTALGWVWTYRVPGGDGFWLLACGLASLALGGAWALQALLAVGSALLTPAPRPAPSRRTLRRWATIPLIFGVAAGLVVSRVPLWVMFRLSRPSMETFATRVLAAPAPAPATGFGGGTTVGLFRLEFVETFPGGVRLITNHTRIFSYAGFAYAPNGVPAWDPDGGCYVHLAGPWYEYYFDD